jgi:hypothetical protein
LEREFLEFKKNIVGFTITSDSVHSSVDLP